MRTPYDSIISLRARETDTAAQAVREAADRVSEVEGQIMQARESIRQEAAFEVEDLCVRSDLYLMRMHGEIFRLEQRLLELQAELDACRDELLQLVAETKALEQVAENYREEQRLAEERADQAQTDDRIGFVHGARLRAAREGAFA